MKKLLRIIGSEGVVFGKSTFTKNINLFSDKKGNLQIIDNNLSGVNLSVLDGEGLYVLPGFVDTHIHGIDGYRLYNLNSQIEAEQNLLGLAKALPKYGVTSFLPTSMSDSYESLGFLCKAVRKFMNVNIRGAAKILGVHLEGPFLSKEAYGAHNIKFLNNVSFEHLVKIDSLSGGTVKIITASPEADPLVLLPKWAESRNITLSIGHTAINGSDFEKMYSKNYCRATHLFNAMPTLGHRKDSLALSILTSGKWIELIMDGHMVHSSWLRLAVILAGWDRVFAVSDGIHLSGNDINIKHGTFCSTKLVCTKNGWVKEADNLVWAPKKNLSDAVPLIFDLSKGDWCSIAKATSSNPVQSFNGEWIGLNKGEVFNAVLLSSKGEVEATILEGEIVFLKNRSRLI